MKRYTPPSILTLTIYRGDRRSRWRERLIRYGVALAAIVLPSLLAWCLMGWVLEAGL